ncbi:unnamed protein product [Absidia cylindrospora]
MGQDVETDEDKEDKESDDVEKGDARQPTTPGKCSWCFILIGTQPFILRWLVERRRWIGGTAFVRDDNERINRLDIRWSPENDGLWRRGLQAMQDNGIYIPPKLKKLRALVQSRERPANELSPALNGVSCYDFCVDHTNKENQVVAQDLFHSDIHEVNEFLEAAGLEPINNINDFNLQALLNRIQATNNKITMSTNVCWKCIMNVSGNEQLTPSQ